MYLLPGVLALCGLVSPGVAQARTIHVPGDYPTIGGAMAAAAPGDEVVVACGTYPEGDIELVSSVTLRSASGDPSCVTIDVQGSGHGLVGVSTRGSARLEGLTVQGAITLLRGGGMACYGCSLSVNDCVFRDNTAERGGALSCLNSAIALERCSFVGNSSFENGGAIYPESSQLLLEDCEFIGNTNPHLGGAVYFRYSPSTIARCTFRSNTARLGGAIYFGTSSSSFLEHCVFAENSVGASSGGAVYCRGIATYPVFSAVRFERNIAGIGGAVEVRDQPPPVFEDCVFWENTASSRGGAVSLNQVAGASFLACTFAGNSAPDAAAAVRVWFSDAEFDRCLLVRNSGDYAVGCGGDFWEVAIRCTDMFENEGGWGGCMEGWGTIEGNFTADPLFCNEDEGDLSLDRSSPCLPGRHPGGEDCGRIGALDQGCGPTATSASTWGALKVRFDPHGP